MLKLFNQVIVFNNYLFIVMYFIMRFKRINNSKKIAHNVIFKIFFLLLLFNKSYSQDSIHLSIVENKKLITKVILEIESNKSLLINNINGSDSLLGEYSGEVAIGDDKKIQRIRCLLDKLNNDITFYYSKDELIYVLNGSEKLYFISGNLYDFDSISLSKNRQDELINFNIALRNMIKILFP